MAKNKADPYTVEVGDTDDMKGHLKKIGGSRSDAFNNTVVNQAIASLWTANSDAETLSKQHTATVAGMLGIAPQDELEGMLAAQLFASHNAAMECYRRAMHKDQQYEVRQGLLNQAGKLSRTYTSLLEALNKHRGKGQQKVTVEHVHVHEGGQAIVGTVSHTGGGGAGKKEEQPHAQQISHASVTPLRSENPDRKAMPVTSDAERTMQDARREKSRCS
ncbi:hypothetical protein Geu3261_0186_001 [Komagataeibacter europaeus NBRC 3261]|uniref:Uncharacterized protein n=1 Tax=Komagataeibacter europaeus NBRC 3261 TaxID=1234669 RepID=A0A0D6Q1K9_KOMEU|nr:hypothetical protein [Komagataeibacter europaeus]GAN97457.1 hypothetical protein Geu3261_0186_001 [Komagataeibacter europaeus NBRC 3261]